MRRKDYLNIDISDTKELFSALRAVHTRQNFEKLMRSAIIRTGKHVKTIVSRDVPKHYEVTQKQVRQHIGGVRVGKDLGTLGIGCSIPIDGKHLSIGGGFKASGGARGWSGIEKGKRYKITAKIVKSGPSTLPEEMKNQGGQPPFRNLSARKLNGVTFTRVSGDKGAKIAKVVGLSVPQMPVNRAEDDVQRDTVEYLMKRMEHEHERVMKGLGR